MSCSRACLVIEREPNKWYCVVAHQEYDDDDFESYNIYGPTTNDLAAFETMLHYESNPGMWDSVPFETLTPYYTNLVDNKLKRNKS